MQEACKLAIGAGQRDIGLDHVRQADDFVGAFYQAGLPVEGGFRRFEASLPLFQAIAEGTSRIGAKSGRFPFFPAPYVI